MSACVIYSVAFDGKEFIHECDYFAHFFAFIILPLIIFFLVKYVQKEAELSNKYFFITLGVTYFLYALFIYSVVKT